MYNTRKPRKFDIINFDNINVYQKKKKWFVGDNNVNAPYGCDLLFVI